MTIRSRARASALAASFAFVVGFGLAASAGQALVVYLPHAAVGTVLVVRRPGHLVGWLLMATAWTFAVSWLEVNESQEALASGAAPVSSLLSAWAKWWWSLPLVLSLLAIMALVFPSGRLAPGRWRPLARIVVLALPAMDLAFAVWPVVEVTSGARAFLMPNPLWPRGTVPPGFPPIPTAAGMLVFIAMVGCLGSILVRLRSARGIERLQLRWLVAGIASIAVAIPLGLVLFALGAGDEAWFPATGAFTLPPLAIGVAVLRYRLYEIDRIISRTIGWALVSGILVTVFAGVVVALQGALEGVTQGQTLAVAASTLLAFALFQPVRRRVQAAVDHRFDRARYDAERIASAFAGHVRSEVDLPRLRLELVRTSDECVRPVTAGVWLRGGLDR